MMQEEIYQLRKPCGCTTGHGESCVAGWLCDSCSMKAKAADEIEKLRGALELYWETYAATQTNPTPVQEATVINTVRALLKK